MKTRHSSRHMQSLAFIAAPIVCASFGVVCVYDISAIHVLSTAIFALVIIFATDGLLKRALRRDDSNIAATLAVVLRNMGIRMIALVSFCIYVSASHLPAGLILMTLACVSMALAIMCEALSLARLEEEPIHV